MLSCQLLLVFEHDPISPLTLIRWFRVTTPSAVQDVLDQGIRVGMREAICVVALQPCVHEVSTTLTVLSSGRQTIADALFTPSTCRDRKINALPGKNQGASPCSLPVYTNTCRAVAATGKTNPT